MARPGPARGCIVIPERDPFVTMGEQCNARSLAGYRVIFVCGGPGSGKGTLAERLARKIGVGHVSTGDLLVCYVAAASVASVQRRLIAWRPPRRVCQ
jgi:hypothetical protein